MDFPLRSLTSKNPEICTQEPKSWRKLNLEQSSARTTKDLQATGAACCCNQRFSTKSWTNCIVSKPQS
jgi:hypothetical protein